MELDIHLASLAECSPERLIYGGDSTADLPISGAIGWRVDELAMLAEHLELGSTESFRARFSLVAGESQHCPWVISFPLDLAAAMATISEDEISSLAMDPASWAGEPSSSVRRKLIATKTFFTQHSAPYALYVTAPPG